MLVIDRQDADRGPRRSRTIDLALGRDPRAQPQPREPWLRATWLIDDRPSQAAYAAPEHIAHDDELVKRFETWNPREHLAEAVSRWAPRSARRGFRIEPKRTLASGRIPPPCSAKPPVAFVQGTSGLEHAVHLPCASRRAASDEIGGARVRLR